MYPLFIVQNKQRAENALWLEDFISFGGTVACFVCEVIRTRKIEKLMANRRMMAAWVGPRQSEFNSIILYCWARADKPSKWYPRWTMCPQRQLHATAMRRHSIKQQTQSRITHWDKQCITDKSCRPKQSMCLCMRCTGAVAFGKHDRWLKNKLRKVCLPSLSLGKPTVSCQAMCLTLLPLLLPSWLRAALSAARRLCGWLGCTEGEWRNTTFSFLILNCTARKAKWKRCG